MAIYMKLPKCVFLKFLFSPVDRKNELDGRRLDVWCMPAREF